MIEKTVLLNGKIYTENSDMPWAEALVINGKHIFKVGSNEVIKKTIRNFNSSEIRIVDLEGKTVLPGLIDGHTHPTVVATTFWRVRMPLTSKKDKLLENIREASQKYPKEEKPFFFAESYFTDTFGIEGPNKRELDSIISDRPARIQDFGDHACWYNSVALKMFMDENGIPHAPGDMGEPEFKKDKSGEYSGWCIESGQESDVPIFNAIDWYPPTVANEETIKPFLDMFKEKGIMCLMDGTTEGEGNLKFFYEMDKNKKLGIYYEGTSILDEINNIDEAIERLKKWQRKYTSEHVHCNVIKFFIDGTNELGDCLSTVPFANDPTKNDYGHANCTVDQMEKVLIRLNKEGIDFHIHTICDGAFRLVCDAVENAQKNCGSRWRIKVTMAHCEIIHPNDIERVGKLGIYIDWSTHWSGGYFGEEAQTYLGIDRWNTMYDFTGIIRSGGKVGFSSDVFSYQEAHRANPYFGIQTAMTRVDPEFPLNPQKYKNSVRPPASAKLTLEQLLYGYTKVNAERMRLDNMMGSIEEGKLANLIVLDTDIFNTNVNEIKDIKIHCTYFDGKKRKIRSTLKSNFA